MNRFAKVGAVLLTFAASLLACQLIVGVQDEEGSAKPDAFAPKIDSAVPDLCAHASIPSERPAATTEGSDLEPLWFAISSMDGLPRSPGESFGFDLDGVCTGFTSGPTAYDGGGSCLPANADDDGGIDNAAPALFRGLPFGYGSKLFDIVTKQVQNGDRTLLVYLSRYNGTPNDPFVQVQLIPTDRLVSTACGPDGGPSDAGQPDGATPTPEWQGCDAWSFAQGRLILTGGQPAPTGLQDGYVKDGRLVVGTTSSTQLSLNVGGLAITVTNSFLVANLKPTTTDAGKKLFALEGLVTGRLAPSSLFEGVARADKAFCDPVLLANLVKPTVCSARDIAEFPSQDFREAPCTAISAALKFSALQATIGPAVPGLSIGDCDASIPKCD